MEENQNQSQVNTPTSWRDIQITSQMPLDALVSFLNVLNQRLALLEELVQCQGPDGKEISVTELYKLQAEAEQNANANANVNQEESKEN